MLLEPHNLRYFGRVPHVLHAIRRISAKQTRSQEIQQPVLNHDQVLFAKFYQFFIHHASASQLVCIQTTTSRYFFKIRLFTFTYQQSREQRIYYTPLLDIFLLCELRTARYEILKIQQYSTCSTLCILVGIPRYLYVRHLTGPSLYQYLYATRLFKRRVFLKRDVLCEQNLYKQKNAI